MRLTGGKDPAEVEDHILEEGREAALARVASGLTWPIAEEGYDPLPASVAWTESWEAAVDATRATEMEDGIDPRVVPSGPGVSAWALGRHADGGPGLWKITMEFNSEDQVEWLAEDLDEEEAGLPPIALLERVPSRESEAANRSAWAARYPSYEPFAPPDDDDDS